MKRIGVLLITIALIAGMVGCGPLLLQYNLTISSTAGGSITTPGEGTFTYFVGTVVALVAEAEEGYYFVNWSGDIAIISCECSSTTITMSGDYSITANFAFTTEMIEIWDWYDLYAVRDNLGGNYLLVNNLDYSTDGYEELASREANQGKGWEPIGTSDNLFTGTFDGQGYEIRDLSINRPDEDVIGLFRAINEGGIIKNIGVVNAAVNGVIVGGLVGANGGTVSNSYCTGNVTGNVGVGGLVGANGGTVSYCYSTGSVTGTGGVGGLVGLNQDESTVSDSYSTGSVTGDLGVGGLVGLNQDESTVSDSYCTGNVTGNSSVGGLAGGNAGTVADSFWDTETSGQSTSDGGIGKTTAQMQDILTFLGAGWNITAVAFSSANTTFIWNIVDDVTYPFLSWQP